jgi:hypothetical protein
MISKVSLQWAAKFECGSPVRANGRAPMAGPVEFRIPCVKKSHPTAVRSPGIPGALGDEPSAIRLEECISDSGQNTCGRQNPGMSSPALSYKKLLLRFVAEMQVEKQAEELLDRRCVQSLDWFRGDWSKITCLIALPI